MDVIFGRAADSQGRMGILVFVDRFSKMKHLIYVYAKVTAVETAMYFIDAVFRNHGLPKKIVSVRVSRFTFAL